MRQRCLGLVWVVCLGLVGCSSDPASQAPAWGLSDSIDDGMMEPDPDPDPDLGVSVPRSAWVGRENVGNCVEDIAWVDFEEGGGRFDAYWLNQNACEESGRGLYACKGGHQWTNDSVLYMSCEPSGEAGVSMSFSGTAWQGEVGASRQLSLGVFWERGSTSSELAAQWRLSYQHDVGDEAAQRWPELHKRTVSIDAVLDGISPSDLMGVEGYLFATINGSFNVSDSVAGAVSGRLDLRLRTYIEIEHGDAVISFVPFDARFPEEQWGQELERKLMLSREQSSMLVRALPYRWRAKSVTRDGEYYWVLLPDRDVEMVARHYSFTEDFCADKSHYKAQSPEFSAWCASP